MASKQCKFHWKSPRSSCCITSVQCLSNTARLLNSKVHDFVVGNNKAMYMREGFCDSDTINVCIDSRVNVCSRLHVHKRKYIYIYIYIYILPVTAHFDYHCISFFNFSQKVRFVACVCVCIYIYTYLFIFIYIYINTQPIFFHDFWIIISIAMLNAVGCIGIPFKIGVNSLKLFRYLLQTVFSLPKDDGLHKLIRV